MEKPIKEEKCKRKQDLIESYVWYCAVCGYEKAITVIPAGTTVIKVRAEAAVELPEDAYTVIRQDWDGNELATGTKYTHTHFGEVTPGNSVLAVLTFSEEIRKAYSVGEKIEHAVTALGESTEYVLVPRDTLTVTGKVERWS